MKGNIADNDISQYDEQEMKEIADRFQKLPAEMAKIKAKHSSNNSPNASNSGLPPPPANTVEAKSDLTISFGVGGARLQHTHQRQFHYVKQTLTLWREILHDFFKLWYLGEADLLDEANKYELKNTGQGLHRLQGCPRIGREMARILHRVQAALPEGWVGSSVVHLGDTNVPNAFMFIDKYTQVSRILNPICMVIDKLPTLCANPSINAYICDEFGSCELCAMEILQDFFKYGFDGSGSDNFFEAGSCIDGRLTSAWNWCSK